MPLVGSAVGPAPPTASPAATGSSAMPMIVMTEPVTTGGKNRMSLLKNGAMRKVNEPGDDDGAVDHQQAVGAAAGGRADGDHRGDGGEGHALQQRQPDADLPEADRLDDRRDAAGEQVGVDQVDQLLGGEPDRVGEQDRHDHGAGVERQHVLEAVDGELADRRDLVDGMAAGSRVALVSGHAPWRSAV